MQNVDKMERPKRNNDWFDKSEDDFIYELERYINNQEAMIRLLNTYNDLLEKELTQVVKDYNYKTDGCWTFGYEDKIAEVRFFIEQLKEME